MNKEQKHIVTLTQEEFNHNLREMILETIIPYVKVLNTESQGFVTNDDFMTREEVAKFIGVSFPTLNKYVRTGKIPNPIQIGRKKMFVRSELLAKLEASRLPKSKKKLVIRKNRDNQLPNS